jgi:hypothetical protein
MYLFYAWLSATPLTENQLKTVQFRGVTWLVVLCLSIIAAPSLGWWRLRMAGFFGGSKEEPIQPAETTRRK